ncbi:hypothetical protein N7495_007818 [Penicillium taxi]|uniref:uncharacterized protein n=1 Tax=Penicillium taxi TaxID=168475 RepID=UPI002545BBD0|nr:uncharacterized protein N7495_007818 [Penicillium taxi]KAJ5887777.1 hypothetical protein N7495_007818 [Penicillium taxi]
MKKSDILGSIVQSLEAMPTELAHQIIDDLRVWDVLKLLCYRSDRIDRCIMSHPICRTLIGSDPETISKVRFATEFFRHCFSKIRKRPIPENSPLYSNIHHVKGWRKNSIYSNMHARLREELTRQYKILNWSQVEGYCGNFGYCGCMNVKSAHARFSVQRTLESGYSFEEMKRDWENIQTPLAAVSGQLALELRWAADMLEANPDILKRTLDSAQKRRPNTAHIVSRMRHGAERFMRYPKARLAACEHFRYLFMPVIPFDSVLDELLDLMKTNGLLDGDKIIKDGFPALVTGLAEIVVRGIPHVYVSDDEICGLHSEYKYDGKIQRTGNTPWNTPIIPVTIDDAFFTPFRLCQGRNFQRQKCSRWEPHSEKEREWLKSFVELYRYLKR